MMEESNLEKRIAYYRCQNKPVIYIAKTLNIDCNSVRYMLKKWKILTEEYINSVSKTEDFLLNPDITGLLKSSDLSLDYAKKLLSNKYVKNYIFLNKNENHNRYMDCLRYHIILLQKANL